MSFCNFHTLQSHPAGRAGPPGGPVPAVGRMLDTAALNPLQDHLSLFGLIPQKKQPEYLPVLSQKREGRLA